MTELDTSIITLENPDRGTEGSNSRCLSNATLLSWLAAGLLGKPNTVVVDIDYKAESYVLDYLAYKLSLHISSTQFDGGWLSFAVTPANEKSRYGENGLNWLREHVLLKKS